MRGRALLVAWSNTSIGLLAIASIVLAGVALTTERPMPVATPKGHCSSKRRNDVLPYMYDCEVHNTDHRLTVDHSCDSGFACRPNAIVPNACAVSPCTEGCAHAGQGCASYQTVHELCPSRKYCTDQEDVGRGRRLDDTVYQASAVQSIYPYCWTVLIEGATSAPVPSTTNYSFEDIPFFVSTPSVCIDVEGRPNGTAPTNFTADAVFYLVQYENPVVLFPPLTPASPPPPPPNRTATSTAWVRRPLGLICVLDPFGRSTDVSSSSEIAPLVASDEGPVTAAEIACTSYCFDHGDSYAMVTTALRNGTLPNNASNEMMIQHLRVTCTCQSTCTHAVLSNATETLSLIDAITVLFATAPAPAPPPSPPGSPPPMGWPSPPLPPPSPPPPPPPPPSPPPPPPSSPSRPPPPPSPPPPPELCPRDCVAVAEYFNCTTDIDSCQEAIDEGRPPFSANDCSESNQSIAFGSDPTSDQADQLRAFRYHFGAYCPFCPKRCRLPTTLVCSTECDTKFWECASSHGIAACSSRIYHGALENCETGCLITQNRTKLTRAVYQFNSSTALSLEPATVCLDAPPANDTIVLDAEDHYCSMELMQDEGALQTLTMYVLDAQVALLELMRAYFTTADGVNLISNGRSILYVKVTTTPSPPPPNPDQCVLLHSDAECRRMINIDENVDCAYGESRSIFYNTARTILRALRICENGQPCYPVTSFDMPFGIENIQGNEFPQSDFMKNSRRGLWTTFSDTETGVCNITDPGVQYMAARGSDNNMEALQDACGMQNFLTTSAPGVLPIRPQAFQLTKPPIPGSYMRHHINDDYFVEECSIQVCSQQPQPTRVEYSQKSKGLKHTNATWIWFYRINVTGDASADTPVVNPMRMCLTNMSMGPDSDIVADQLLSNVQESVVQLNRSQCSTHRAPLTENEYSMVEDLVPPQTQTSSDDSITLSLWNPLCKETTLTLTNQSSGSGDGRRLTTAVHEDASAYLTHIVATVTNLNHNVMGLSSSSMNILFQALGFDSAVGMMSHYARMLDNAQTYLTAFHQLLAKSRNTFLGNWLGVPMDDVPLSPGTMLLIFKEVFTATFLEIMTDIAYETFGKDFAKFAVDAASVIGSIFGLTTRLHNMVDDKLSDLTAGIGTYLDALFGNRRRLRSNETLSASRDRVAALRAGRMTRDSYARLASEPVVEAALEKRIRALHAHKTRLPRMKNVSILRELSRTLGGVEEAPVARHRQRRLSPVLDTPGLHSLADALSTKYRVSWDMTAVKTGLVRVFKQSITKFIFQDRYVCPCVMQRPDLAQAQTGDPGSFGRTKVARQSLPALVRAVTNVLQRLIGTFRPSDEPSDEVCVIQQGSGGSGTSTTVGLDTQSNDLLMHPDENGSCEFLKVSGRRLSTSFLTRSNTFEVGIDQDGFDLFDVICEFSTGYVQKLCNIKDEVQDYLKEEAQKVIKEAIENMLREALATAAPAVTASLLAILILGSAAPQDEGDWCEDFGQGCPSPPPSSPSPPPPPHPPPGVHAPPPPPLHEYSVAAIDVIWDTEELYQPVEARSLHECRLHCAPEYLFLFHSSTMRCTCPTTSWQPTTGTDGWVLYWATTAPTVATAQVLFLAEEWDIEGSFGAYLNPSNTTQYMVTNMQDCTYQNGVSCVDYVYNQRFGLSQSYASVCQTASESATCDVFPPLRMLESHYAPTLMNKNCSDQTASICYTGHGLGTIFENGGDSPGECITYVQGSTTNVMHATPARLSLCGDRGALILQGLREYHRPIPNGNYGEQNVAQVCQAGYLFGVVTQHLGEARCLVVTDGGDVQRHKLDETIPGVTRNFIDLGQFKPPTVTDTASILTSINTGLMLAIKQPLSSFVYTGALDVMNGLEQMNEFMTLSKAMRVADSVNEERTTPLVLVPWMTQWTDATSYYDSITGKQMAFAMATPSNKTDSTPVDVLTWST